MGMFDMSGNSVLPLDCENNDLNGLLASISSASANNPFPSQYKAYEEAMASLQRDSFCLGDLLKGTMEAQVVLSDRDSADVLLKPNSSMNSLIAKNSCFGACGGELSSFDLLEQQLVSNVRAQEVADVCFTNENAFASSKLLVQDSALTSLCSMDRGSFQDKLQNSLDNQYSTQSSVTDVDFPSSSNALHELSENLEPVDMSEEILKFSSMDDLCQWFGPSSEDSISEAVIALDNTFTESPEFNPTSFDLVGSSSINNISMTCLHNSNSDGKETSVVMHSTEKGLLDSMELDFSYDQADEWWANTLTPVVSGVTDTGFSECISELNTDTLTGTRKRLFSELRIEELLRGGASYYPFNSSEFEYELSPNRRQTVESSSMNRNPMHFTNLHRPGTRADLVQPLCDLDSTNNLPSKKDTFPKLQAGMRIDDSHSINIGKAVPVPPQKPEEPAKPTKKRARPGESTRPRPKDRQQIQDCIKELRGIIPNGGKCSIDSLLDRTIRYMLFLQSVLKYADKLQEPNEPKLIEQANEVVLKDSGVADSKNCGITWAFEVAHQTMLCPIIVEDMSLPGHMLIEMLCEEQGFFLELIDIVRGLGLNILKAKMEKRKKKLWARFIVEANRHVTRIDVFWSLIHLLQQTNISGIDSSNKHCDVIDANI
ncbi:Transcription factor LHW [Spatholobus suberectus]|nr:Transcription factor LHW [Spatholobus suberectus]